MNSNILKYDKAEIARRAGAYAATMSKEEALRQAWADAKRDRYYEIVEGFDAYTEKVGASELRAGDILKIEYGREGNIVVCEVNGVHYNKGLRCYVVSAVTLGAKLGVTRGLADFEFCTDLGDMLDRYASTVDARIAI